MAPPNDAVPRGVSAQLEHMQRSQQDRVLLLVNGLVDRCFDNCVTDFGLSKRLADSEADCMRTCVQKFLILSERAGSTFNEILSKS